MEQFNKKDSQLETFLIFPILINCKRNQQNCNQEFSIFVIIVGWFDLKSIVIQVFTVLNECVLGLSDN